MMLFVRRREFRPGLQRSNSRHGSAKTEIYKEGASSLQLHDSAVANYFLRTFGRHQRRITCDCERSDQPTVVQVLHLNDGDTLNSKLSDPRSQVGRWITEGKPLEEIVEDAYLISMCAASAAENASDCSRWPKRHWPAATSDGWCWKTCFGVLMTSPEFLFTH